MGFVAVCIENAGHRSDKETEPRHAKPKRQILTSSQDGVSGMEKVALVVIGAYLVFLDDWIVRTRVRKQGLGMSDGQIRQASLVIRGVGAACLTLAGYAAGAV